MIEQVQENYGSQGDRLVERLSNMSDGELLSMYLMSDKEIVEEIFYNDEDESIAENLVDKIMTHIDKLTGGSTARKLDSKVFKKGFNNYKARQRYKKNKKGR